jgi:hypothetical protein
MSAHPFIRHPIHSVALVGVLFGLTPTPPSDAAVPQQVEPMAAVQQLFDAMRAGDAERARAVFARDIRFALLDPTGASVVVQPLDGFLRSMAASSGNWNEQIYDVEVRVDGHVASVWAPFTFYLNGNLSHCGTNSIELLRDATGWKITQISDTRRTEGCPDPLAG